MGPYRSGTPPFSSAYNRITSSNNVLRTRVAIFNISFDPHNTLEGGMAGDFFLHFDEEELGSKLSGLCQSQNQ